MTTTLTDLTDLIGWLRTQRGDFPGSLIRYFDRNGTLTDRQVAAAERMRNRGAAPDAPANPITDLGFFMKDGEVYKTKRSQAGNLYVMKRLANGSWEYVRGGLRIISNDDRINPEQAAQHGLAFGICIFCNAELDDQDGLGKIVGVGPVCARRHLGLTQRQLADRLGVRPDAAPAGAHLE